MSDRDRYIKTLKARAPSAEHVKRITAHFEAQSDLFTQCKCGAHLRGTLAEIKAHLCPEIQELIHGKGS